MANIHSTRGYSSPGVGYKEQEIIPMKLGPDPGVVGIIGLANRGPLGLTHISNEKQLREIFGDDVDGDYGLIAAALTLRYSEHVIYCRVVSDSANFATAGNASTNKLVFSSRTYTEELNGGTIVISIIDEDKKASVQVNDKDGNVVEKLAGFHVNFDKIDDKFIENVINDKSKTITVKYNADATDTSYDTSESTVFPAIITLPVSEGNAGNDIDDADIIGAGNQGIQAFKSPDTVDISTLIIPNRYSEDIFDAVKSLIEYRGDIMFVPDYPRGLTPDQVIDFFNGEGEYSDRTKVDNAWFAAYYGGWIHVHYRNKSITVPPSVIIPMQWGYNDHETHCWFAPAGFDNDTGYGRGVILNAIGIEYEPQKEERDKLYENGINPITRFVGKGVVLFGNKTLKRTGFFEDESLMTALNVRRLCNYIRKLVVRLSYTELFNPNDTFTWTSWRLKIEKRLELLRVNRAVTRYRVIMDSSTVSSEDIRNRRMPGTMYVQPIPAAEWIPITFIATDSSVYFDEGTPVGHLEEFDQLVTHNSSF